MHGLRQLGKIISIKNNMNRTRNLITWHIEILNRKTDKKKKKQSHDAKISKNATGQIFDQRSTIDVAKSTADAALSIADVVQSDGAGHGLKHCKWGNGSDAGQRVGFRADVVLT